MKAMALGVLLATVTFGPTPVGAASSCESLASRALPDTTITMAQSVAAGALVLPGGRGTAQNDAFKSLPAFCRVAATLKPTTDSDIKIEVWMPASNWNGKFQAVGNGGWAGTISYPAMSEALRRGYATSSTDTGHSSSGGSFALEHPEKLVDYAYRSEHEMTVKAKALIEAFYGNSPRLSYFNGCSTGGRQALVEAQRFPNDYDGIIAGAAANPKTHLDAWRISLVQATSKDSVRYVSSAKYPAIHKAVLDACDALDGLKDGLIDDPTRCHFDPGVLTCKGAESADCLTAPQVEAVKTILSPAKSHAGAEIFPGFEPGSELAWGRLLGGPDPYATALDQFKYIVFGDPKWDWRTFDLDRDVAVADKSGGRALSAVDTDLGRFAGHGGKLLMYHGWSDQDIPPRASVNYYNGVASKMGGAAKTSEWVRLFMVPGMGHCGGGEGPNTFDMVTPLEQWVERKQAPENIVASHKTDGKVDRTRPLCPYPQVARYTGTGSSDEATNFMCTTLRN